MTTKTKNDWPRWLVPLVVLVPAALVFPGVEIDAAFFAPKALGLALAVLAVAVTAARGGRVARRLDGVDLASGVLALVLFLAALRAPGGLASGRTTLVLDASALLLFLLLRDRAVTASGLARGLSLLAAVLALPVVLEALGVVWIEDVPRRPIGLLGNRNTVAHLLALLLPVITTTIVRARRAPVAFAHAALAAAVVGVIAMTRCRGAWIAGALGLLVSLGLHAVSGDRRRLAVLAGLLTAAAVLGAVLPWPGLHWRTETVVTAARVVDLADGTGRERLEDAETALAGLRESPLLGAGLHAWPEIAARHAHSVADRHAERLPGPSSPVSDALRLALELGLVGLLAVAVWLATTLRRASRNPRAGLSRATVAGLGTSLVVSMVVDVPLLHAETLAVLACVGAALVPRPSSAASAASVASRVYGWARGPVVPLACALVFLATLRVASGQLAAHARTDADLELADALWPSTPVRLALASRGGDHAQGLSRCERALELAPASYGLLLAAAAHAERIGEAPLAAAYRARALAVEPHAHALERARRDRRRAQLALAREARR